MKRIAPSGQDFVPVCLVADIPNQDIVRRIEDIMQCNGQFDHAEARAQMPFFRRHHIDDKSAQFLRHLRKLVLRKPAQAARFFYLLEQSERHAAKVNLKSYFCRMDDIFTDDYFMRKALAEAAAAYEKGEIPIGAVIVVNNQVIARSHNLTEMLNDVTAHAEMQSITAAANFLGGKYLRGCTLYVTVEPCQMCAGALYWSQISKVVFGSRDEQRGYLNMGTQLHPKTEVVQGVMADACGELMLRFFRERRK